MIEIIKKMKIKILNSNMNVTDVWFETWPSRFPIQRWLWQEYLWLYLCVSVFVNMYLWITICVFVCICVCVYTCVFVYTLCICKSVFVYLHLYFYLYEMPNRVLNCIQLYKPEKGNKLFLIAGFQSTVFPSLNLTNTNKTKI